MKTLFDAGKLVGEDMNDCYLMVEQAAVTFPDNQVSVLFFHFNLVSSSHVFCLYISHCRTVYTTCSEPQRIPGTLRMKLYICFGLTVRRGILWKKRPWKVGRHKNVQEFLSPWWGRERFSGHFYFLLHFLQSPLPPGLNSSPSSLLAQPSPLAEALDGEYEERWPCIFLFASRTSRQ